MRKSILTPLLTAAAFYSFFVFGFSDNIKGPTLSAMKAELGVNDAQAGTIFMGAYIGFLIATTFTGLLAERLGKKGVLVLAALCLAGGVWGYGSFSAVAGLALAMAVLGLGQGATELGANAVIVDLHAARSGSYLNLLAVFHGLGSMLAPLYAAWLLQSGQSWREVYRWSSLLAVVMLLTFVLLRFPANTAPRSSLIRWADLRRVALRDGVGWFYLAIGLYVATEIGLATWLVEFLQKNRAASVGQSNLFLSLFFGAILTGRLAGSFLVERVGYLRAILVAAAAATGCLALGFFGPSGLAFFFPAAGLFLSVIFPTLTAAVSRRYREQQSVILGLLFSSAGIGGMLGPWLVGMASNRLTLQAGFGINLISCLLLTGVVFILRKGDHHEPDPVTLGISQHRPH